MQNLRNSGGWENGPYHVLDNSLILSSDEIPEDMPFMNGVAQMKADSSRC